MADPRNPRLTAGPAGCEPASPVIRLYAIPWSTNVERVSLALAHKGLDAEVVMLDPADRSRVVELSGQDLVPVIEHDGRVVADSPAILEYLEELQPEPALFPADPAREAELRVFVDWFNRVWKVAPNAIADAIDDGAADPQLTAEHASAMAGALDLFDALLAGRDYLFGAELSAADLVVFPFVKYATIAPAADDDETFHHVLHNHQRIGDSHPRLAAWIERVDALPRTPGA